MRTKKAIKGSLVEIIPTIIIALIGFIKTKVFIDYLGSSMNGYYQFINQFVSYLFLAEAGFGTAITYKMYKPIAEKDNRKVSQIYYGGLKIFRRIGIFMSAGILIFSLFLTFFIKESKITQLVVIISFILISLSNIISFLLYSRMYQAIYSANQEKHITSSITNVIKIIAEILLIIVTIKTKSLLAIAVVLFLTKVLEEIIFISICKRRLSFIEKVPKEEYDTSSYKMTKDLIFSQIGYLVFNNIDIVIIMVFNSLGAVAVSIYSAYNYILKFIFSLVAKISGICLHLLGNVFVKDDTDKSKSIFNEYLSFSFIIACICSICYFIGARSFINIWINDNIYLLNTITILSFSGVMFLSMAMEPLTGIISANGLFKDSKYYTLISSAVNLILSIILCNYLGIFGVLLATAIAYILDILFRLLLISKKVFTDIKWSKIAMKYIVSFGIFIMLSLFSIKLEMFAIDYVTNYLKFGVFMIIVFFAVTILIIIIYGVLFKSSRALFKRTIKLLRWKK